MSETPLSRSWRYLIAVLGVALATIARLALASLVGFRYPYTIYVITLLLTAWYCGLGPSILAAVLGGLTGLFLFQPPGGSFAIPDQATLFGLFVYAFVCMAVIAVSQVQRASRRRLEREIAERRAVERDLRAQARMLDLALVLVRDPEGRIVLWNTGAEQLYGWSKAEATGQVSHELLKTRFPRPLEEITAELRRSGHWQGELVHTRRDGAQLVMASHWVLDRDADGNPTAILEVNNDITERRRAEERVASLQTDLVRRIEELETLLDLVPVGVAIADDPQCLTMRANRALLQMLDANPGTNVSTTAPEDQRPGWRICRQGRELATEELPLQRCAATGEEVRDRECELVFEDGRSLHILVSSNPLRDEAGQPKGCIGVLIDITERRRSEQVSRFLANASASLAELIDPESMLQRVARLAVPFFADWCVVDLVDEDEKVNRVATAHADPAKEPLVRRLRADYPISLKSGSIVQKVLKTGRSQLIPEVTDQIIRQVARDPEHERQIRALDPRSMICVPLVVRNRSFGAMGFILSDPRRRYGPADLVVAEDLARRASVSIENAQLYRDIKEADHRKTEFLAMLAHELRNPLGPIRNAAYLLRGPSADHDEERPALLNMIDRQVETMIRLVDDLLDISRISRGKIQFRKEIVNFACVVERAVNSARPLIKDRGHQFDVRIPPEPVHLEADPTRFEQILWNLLNNAAKYTDPGGQISLMAEQVNGEVVVRVRDTGIGLEPAMLPRIFDLFTQVDHRWERTQGGLGIGLSLVMSLVKLHGGTISANSDGPGTGSEFVVRLPLLNNGNPVACLQAETPAEAVSEDIAPHRILIVDDNVDAAESLAKVLSLLYRQDVRVAHDGPTALRMAEEFRPELAFLDIGLPGMSGFEIAATLRQQDWSKDCTLVAVTGWGQEQDRTRSREAGFDHHLVKPAEPDTLRKLLLGQLSSTLG